MIDWLQVPLPDVADPDLAEFWEGTRHEEFRVPYCSVCSRFSWPPRGTCPHCLSLDMGWRPVEGIGTLFSWTVVGHTSIKGFKEHLPFAVGVITLDGADGVRVVGRLTDPPDALMVDARVEVGFEPVTEELHVPVWSQS